MDSLKSMPDVLTVQQLAAVLNISRRSTYQLLQNNLIRHRKIGRIYRISKRAVIDYLEK